jgi:hypothetical protein
MRYLTPRLTLAILVVALVAVGPGRASAERPHGEGRLHVSVHLVPGARDFRHGAKARLRVRDSSGRTVVLHRGRRPLSRRLPAGQYHLMSWQRPCADRHCRRLRAATARCTLDVALGSGQRVFAVVLLDPGRGCRLETADPPASPRRR